jgi:two-component system, sensor histidine kinase RegB
MVRAAWTWMLVALSFVGFGLLVFAHEPLPMPDSTRMVGMWVALGVASAFVVHFLLRITGALAAREGELAAARHLAARQERLASLATMAAGAAHELSTPLGTVALAAKELERALLAGRSAGAPAAAAAPDDRLIDDARLIREQVGRCRTILDQMAQGAGTIGESLSKLSVRELLAEAATGTRAAPTLHVQLSPEVADLLLEMPRQAVASALRSLLTNAQDASSPEHSVVVRAVAEAAGSGEQLALSIIDRGAGMDSDVLSRIGEPFFTTKAPGRGMGLGMFLARAVVEGVGGTLHLDSVPGRGTTAQVTLPLRPLPAPSEAARSPAASQPLPRRTHPPELP